MTQTIYLMRGGVGGKAEQMYDLGQTPSVEKVMEHLRAESVPGTKAQQEVVEAFLRDNGAQRSGDMYAQDTVATPPFHRPLFLERH
jgi:hypothetical protein